MITANHPNCPIGFQQALGGGKPVAAEFVIGGKAGKLIPVIINGVHFGIVGAVQIALQLQVIRRVRKYKVNAARRQGIHLLDAIARQNLVQRQGDPQC